MSGISKATYKQVVVVYRDLLSQINGQQLDDLLKLYTKKDIKDLETCKAVAKLLENNNKFISKN